MKIGVSLPVRELGNDIDLIVEFAQAAEELGLTHLRVPEQVYRADSGPLHESMTMMTISRRHPQDRIGTLRHYVAARPTVLVAKQAATLTISPVVGCASALVSGRTQRNTPLWVRISTRAATGAKSRWSSSSVCGRKRLSTDADRFSGAGVNPLPVQKPIPMGRCRRLAD